VWSGQEDAVHASYLLPVQHLVIARYLFDLFKEKTNGKEPQMLPLAISDTEFRIEQAIEERPKGSIIMLYSDEHWKGSRYGIDALLLVHEKFPGLQVQLFGVPVTPPGLPEWMHYTQKPGNLRELYNQASIFISPSLREGWALPPAEAMACGCAVVCTRIGGHLDYAIDQQTALLAEPENPEQMANKIMQLIEDDTYRKQIAQNGHQLMQTKFNWDVSVNRLEQYFTQQ
jgi:glycosyltransferase involved in cell wall biosynthesis